MSDFVRVDDVRDAQQQLQFDTEAFLRKTGWKHSSSHPGSYWLWTKEIEGKSYSVEMSMALALEAAIEPAEDADESA